ncbi:mechanosensitive ion channel [Kamptonema cortianum]|nr:mechanosensitive ion channel [Geitlerinema splendidum]MDK3160360.1 mechanosensitive ion channel [Kamptonema cortianum]
MTWESIVEWSAKPLFTLGNTELTAGHLIRGLVFAVVVIFFSRVVRALVRRALHRAQLDEGSRNAVATVVYYLFLAFGFAWVLNSFGLDATGIAVFTGTLGFGIGLGFQDVAKNFISGIIMLLSRTIKPNDVITVGDLTGRVHVVGMYSSTMKTVQDATVIIPNSQILSDKFVNWTHDKALRMIEIPIGVHYDSDLDVVQECLRQAAEENDQILSEPPIRILLTAFGDSSVNFVARVWTNEVMYYQRVVSQYNLRIWQLFKEKGVIIPYPQQDVYIHQWPDKPSAK